MQFYPFLDAYGMFFIYAFIGWVVEVIYYGLDEGKFINRGFLNGPLCPVYGIGFYGVILLLEQLSGNFFLLFFGSMFICTTVEFLAGVLLYKLFHLRWWDYRDEKYNIMGFICPKFSLYWGIACSLGMFVLHPTVLWILHWLPDIPQVIILCVFSTILVCDIIATVMAIVGFKRRLGPIHGISGEMKVISDKIGGSIYEGVDTVITKSQPTIANYNAWHELYARHRKEEKELARKHRAEEKELFGNILPKVRPSQIHPKEILGNRVAAVMRTLKRSERRVSKTVYLNNSEPGKTAFDYLTRFLPFTKKNGVPVEEEESDLDIDPELDLVDPEREEDVEAPAHIH